MAMPWGLFHALAFSSGVQEVVVCKPTQTARLLRWSWRAFSLCTTALCVCIAHVSDMGPKRKASNGSFMHAYSVHKTLYTSHKGNNSDTHVRVHTHAHCM